MANSKNPLQAGISTFALSNRPRATRSIVAKVRTGCITCKRRHVKCDESKPSCSRCLKWRGYCEGYGTKTGPSEGKQDSPRKDDDHKKEENNQRGSESSRYGSQKHAQTQTGIQANTQTQTSTQTQKRLESFQQSVPRWFPALTAESQRLLHEARNDTLCVSTPDDYQQPSGTPDSPTAPRDQGSTGSRTPEMLRNPTSTSTSAQVAQFWKETVPSLMRQNASVHYANLAIHTLIDAHRTNCGGEALSGTRSYNLALRYFGVALAEVQKQTISPRSLQSATLCCLFFIIFEMMNGDERAAQTHFANGTKMLAELGRAADPSKPAPDTEAIMYRELRMTMWFLAVQIYDARGPSGTTKKAVASSSG